MMIRVFSGPRGESLRSSRWHRPHTRAAQRTSPIWQSFIPSDFFFLQQLTPNSQFPQTPHCVTRAGSSGWSPVLITIKRTLPSPWRKGIWFLLGFGLIAVFSEPLGTVRPCFLRPGARPWRDSLITDPELNLVQGSAKYSLWPEGLAIYLCMSSSIRTQPHSFLYS